MFSRWRGEHSVKTRLGEHMFLGAKHHKGQIHWMANGPVVMPIDGMARESRSEFVDGSADNPA